jgi:hypothetical protein
MINPKTLSGFFLKDDGDGSLSSFVLSEKSDSLV